MARRRLEKVLGEVKPDAVLCHACWPHALFAPVVRAAGLPLVFWARDLHSGRHWLERWGSLTPPDYVLANSRFTLQTVDRIFPKVQSEVVHPPVLPPPVLPPSGSSTFKAPARNLIRAELGTSPEAVVIIQSCRLERWKGHQLLLDALATLAEVPNWVCWIAGGGQRPHEEAYFCELQEKARLHGIADRVQFLGQRQDVVRLLSAADIHCQPNTAPEPFGVAFVEALYAGLPVVTTQFGGALEVLDDGCSIMVQPGDKMGLARGLCQLITNASMRQQLGVSSPARAAMLCDPKSQLEKLCKILAGLSRKSTK
jgi:glycosyltransferase involved in cell wall biosynthesis